MASRAGYTSGAADDGLTPNQPPLSFHPAFGAPVNLRVTAQPVADEPKTLDTVSHMAYATAADALQPAFIALAYALGGRQIGGLANLFAWVKQNVRFVPDAKIARLAGLPDDTEVLIRPVDLITMRDPQGDCDDFSMLTACLGLASGRRVALKTIAAAADPNYYTHVYALVEDDDGTFRPMDTSHGPYPGWEAIPTGKTRVWPIDQSALSGGSSFMHNLSAIDWGAIVGKSVDAASNIFTARFAVPPVGTTIQTPQGVVTRPYQGDPLTFPGVSISTPGNGSVLWIVGGVLVAVIALSTLRK